MAAMTARAAWLEEATLTPTKLPERIVDFIMEGLSTGALKPGERLPEVEIAQALGTSRTPVREALRQLQSDGFVEIRPHRGASVVELGPQETAELYLCRAYLLGLAARLAAGMRTDGQLESMRRLLEALRNLLDDQTREYSNCLSRFNDLVVEGSRSETVAAMLAPLNNQALLLRRQSITLPDRRERSLLYYEKLEESIRLRRGSDAERFAKGAVLESGQALLGALFGVTYKQQCIHDIEEFFLD